MDEDALAGDRGCDPCIDSNTAKQATRDVGEPINTATGDYSYSPEPDIQISGHGHNLSFRRIYSTASNWRYLDAVPMGDHWSHNFNMQLVFDSNPAAALVGESGKFITGNNAAHRFRPVDEVDANGDPTGKRVYEFADTFLAELHVCQNVGDSTSYSTDGCTEDVMTYDSYNENYGYYEVVLHDNTRYILERRSGATSGSTTQSATQSEETEIVITPVPPADPGPTNIAQIIRKYEPGNTVPLVFTYSSFAEVRARTGTDGGIDGYARDYLKSIEIGESGRGIQFNYLHGTGAENPPIEIATYNDIGDHPVDETAGTDLYFSVLLESVSYLGSASPNVDYNYGHAELQPLASSSYTKQDGSPVDFISHYTTNPTKGYRLISVNDIRGETWEYGYEAFNRDSNGFIDLTITGLTFMTQVTNPEDQIIERQTYYTKADINADNAAALDVNYDDLHRVKEQYRGPVSGGELIVRLNYSNNGLGSAFTGANNVFRLANNGGISFETRVEDGNGNTRIYNYDTAGTLDSVELVQPDGTEETVSAADYSLTNAYRPAQLTSSGILNPLEMIWSEDGERLLQQTDEENNVTSFDYSPPHSQDYNVPHQIIGPRDRDQDGDDMTNDPLQVTTIHYETNPYLATLPTSITNALGLNTNLNYQPDGKLDTVTGPDGIVTHHGYSADGDLTNITVGGGIETRYDYDAMGRVERTCRVGNNGNEICQYVDYDAAGNVTQTIEDETGEAIITNIEYDGAARPHVITDVLGRKTYMFYDEASRLVRTIENCTASECSRTTPRSATTSDTNIITDHVYDPVGNLITVIDTLGRTDHTCYDVWSRPVRTVQNATVDYDEACGDISPSPTNASNPDDNIVTEFIYDDRSNLATVVYPMAEGERRRDHTCYDNLNRPIKTIENASSEYQSQSDACDNASRGQSENVITEIAYDEAGNVTQVTLPDNTVNQFRYDALDRQYATILNHVDTVTDPTTENLTTITLFDESGNVKSLIEPDGDITYHCYDSVRRLKNTVVNVSASSTDLGIPSSVDAKNTVIDIEGVACQDNYTPAADADKDVILTYTYDQYERVKTVTSPLDDDSSVTTTYDYDGLSRVVREHKTYTNAGVDTLGRTTFHDYDDGGRVTRITEAEGTTEARTHRFFYDEMDRRTSTVMNYQDGVYDPTTPDMDVVTSAQYTAVGFMKTQTGPNGNPTINHEDGLYRVHQIEDAYGHRSTFEYDAVGNLQKTIDRNGNATTYNYDGMYRQEETISPQTDNTGENYSTFIQYDAMGHPHIVTDAEQVQTRLDYDALGRVVEVRENYVQNMNNNVLDSTTGEYINVQTEYTYDVDGNLNQVELPSFGGGERKFDFTYDAMNRRTGFDAPGFEDDWTTQYDQGGRPIFVTTPQDADPQDPDAYTAQMYYDDQGRPADIGLSGWRQPRRELYLRPIRSPSNNVRPHRYDPIPLRPDGSAEVCRYTVLKWYSQYHHLRL